MEIVLWKIRIEKEEKFELDLIEKREDYVLKVNQTERYNNIDCLIVNKKIYEEYKNDLWLHYAFQMDKKSERKVYYMNKDTFFILDFHLNEKTKEAVIRHYGGKESFLEKMKEKNKINLYRRILREETKQVKNRLDFLF